MAAGSDTPSISATCGPGQSSTSRRIRAARCRAGRYCRAAISASRIPALDATIAPGSAASPGASGKGSSHGTSGAAASPGTSGPSAGAPSPAGSGRRSRFSIARRQALVAMRYSQVRSDERPSKRP